MPDPHVIPLSNWEDYSLILQFDGSGPTTPMRKDSPENISGFGLLVLAPESNTSFREIDRIQGSTNVSKFDFLTAQVHTNQTAELTGCGQALIYLYERYSQIQGKKVQIRYDSTYAVDFITRGTVNSKAANYTLITNLLAIYRQVQSLYGEENIDWKHIRAHSNEKYSDIVDSMARAGRQTTITAEATKIRQLHISKIAIPNSQILRSAIQQHPYQSNFGEIKMKIEMDTFKFQSFIDVVATRNPESVKEFLKTTSCLQYFIKTDQIDDLYSLTNTCGLCALVALYQIHLRSINHNPQGFRPQPLDLSDQNVREQLMSFYKDNSHHLNDHTNGDAIQFFEKAMEHLQNWNGNEFTTNYTKEAWATDDTVINFKHTPKTLFRDDTPEYVTLQHIRGESTDKFFPFTTLEIQQQCHLGRILVSSAGTHFSLIQNKEPLQQDTKEPAWITQGIQNLVTDTLTIIDKHIATNNNSCSESSRNTRTSATRGVDKAVSTITAQQSTHSRQASSASSTIAKGTELQEDEDWPVDYDEEGIMGSYVSEKESTSRTSTPAPEDLDESFEDDSQKEKPNSSQTNILKQRANSSAERIRHKQHESIACDKCNNSFLSKGYHTHYAACKGKLQRKQQQIQRIERSHNAMVTQQNNRYSINYPKGRDANTKLMELNWDEIPALIGLGSPPVNFSKSQRVLRTRIFNFLIEKCKQQPHVKDHWKRFALSHALLNADCHKNSNLPFSKKCEYILDENWDLFTLGKFKGKFSEIQQIDRDTIDDDICNENIDIDKKTNKLLKMIQKGELSRDLEQFLSDAKMAARHFNLPFYSLI